MGSLTTTSNDPLWDFVILAPTTLDSSSLESLVTKEGILLPGDTVKFLLNYRLHLLPGHNYSHLEKRRQEEESDILASIIELKQQIFFHAMGNMRNVWRNQLTHSFPPFTSLIHHNSEQTSTEVEDQGDHYHQLSKLLENEGLNPTTKTCQSNM